MGLLNGFGKANTKYSISVDKGVSVRKLRGSYPFISSTKTIEEYPISEPYAYVKIMKIPKHGESYHYLVQEDPLNKREFEVFRKIVGILGKEMDSPKKEDNTPFEEYVYKQAEATASKYRRSLGKFTERSWKKVFYYVVRELAGYGPLHAMFLDENIEDISYNGLKSPIYVWHSKYESIPTNIAFTDEQTANDFLVKLAHRSSKHISSAQPILDAMLPQKHRLAATFMKEVSTKGSTFCIRKFRADPFSIVDLIKRGTVNERVAAYFWLLLEQKMSFMILGGTGAGKTSMLNSILSLMSQNDKLVTVEEVPELTPPLENWTQLHTRQSFQFSSGSSATISIFDLIKTSLRYRPDYIIVGEVRGEEAYVLFQALATGHGGLCTIHADSLDNVIKRLTSPPMNVSKVYIPLMNVAVYIQRVELPKKREGINFGRRIRAVWEIEDFEQYHEIVTWNPHNDDFSTNFEESYQLKRISTSSGLSMDDLMRELETRENFIKEMVSSNVRDQKEIAEKVLSYYSKKRDEKNDTKLSSVTRPPQLQPPPFKY